MTMTLDIWWWYRHLELQPSKGIYIYIYIYMVHDHQAWGNSKSAGLGDKFPLQKKMDRIWKPKDELDLTWHQNWTVWLCRQNAN